MESQSESSEGIFLYLGIYQAINHFDLRENISDNTNVSDYHIRSQDLQIYLSDDQWLRWLFQVCFFVQITGCLRCGKYLFSA